MHILLFHHSSGSFPESIMTPNRRRLRDFEKQTDAINHRYFYWNASENFLRSPHMNETVRLKLTHAFHFSSLFYALPLFHFLAHKRFAPKTFSAFYTTRSLQHLFQCSSLQPQTLIIMCFLPQRASIGTIIIVRGDNESLRMGVYNEMSLLLYFLLKLLKC